ncbi:hypothetical protein [Pseudomonas sp. NBRC 111124]|uniref:hypothetical protein n=1 Tax=Pseudomonas sp. NBRC 111124 TaxID=1661039 RepID=UPI0007610459|nr:hypothetical protein [Pseudomonas sp. NBRC 111124]
MDQAEALSKEYLRRQGFTTIEFEPDGNVPPDFVCDGRVAVEVRRLNHHHTSSGQHPEALDKKGIALWNHVKRALLELGPPTSGRSWWLSYSLKRPVPEFKRLPSLLKKSLLDFRHEPREGRQVIEVTEGFRITLTPAEVAHDLQFVFASASDRDSTGWLFEMMQTNLQLCIDEKALKIAKVQERYGQWWLILVDMIAMGLSKFDQELFADAVQIERRGWDKIILIDPRDPGRSFEI